VSAKGTMYYNALLLQFVCGSGNATWILGKNWASEICTFLGYYAAYSGNPLLMFRDNLFGSIFEVQEI
jgi:hypothetical protein